MLEGIWLFINWILEAQWADHHQAENGVNLRSQKKMGPLSTFTLTVQYTPTVISYDDTSCFSMWFSTDHYPLFWEPNYPLIWNEASAMNTVDPMSSAYALMKVPAYKTRSWFTMRIIQLQKNHRLSCMDSNAAVFLFLSGNTTVAGPVNGLKFLPQAGRQEMTNDTDQIK